MQANENMYLISQFYGIKLHYLLTFNRLSAGQEPAEGVSIYLTHEAPGNPLLRQAARPYGNNKQQPIQPLQPQLPKK